MAYPLNFVFGKKGSGKSCYLTFLALKYKKKHIPVYCTDSNIPFTIYFPIECVGKFRLPDNSVLLIDEVGTIWNCRDYKSFPYYVRDFFKYQRHYKCTVYMCSQAFDVDKSLRDLTDNMYLISKKFPFLSCIRKIKKDIILTQPVADQPSTISENLRFDSFFNGGLSFLFLPKYWKLFNSFCVPELPFFEVTNV